MLDTSLIRESFKHLAPQGARIGGRFFDRLFADYPDLQTLFLRTDFTDLNEKLFRALSLIVRSLDRPEALSGYLERLGAEHAGFGVQELDYQPFLSTLHAVLAEFAGPQVWTSDVAAAWQSAFDIVAQCMQQGAGVPASAAAASGAARLNLRAEIGSGPPAFEPGPGNLSQRRASAALSPRPPEPVTQVAVTAAERKHVVMSTGSLPPVSAAPHAHAGEQTTVDQFYNLSESAPVGLMFLQLDGVVGYLNQKGQDFFRQFGEQFGVDVEDLVGGPVNRLFAAVPELQKVLRAPGGSKKFVAKVGDESFEVSVQAAVDSANKRIGTIVVWDLATQRIFQQSLFSMLENIPTNILVADTNLKLTYANPASLKKLRELQAFLPIPVDQLVGQSIDVFHKNPAHQRRMLQNPENLPHRAKIQVGTETLDLLVSAVRDDQGKYLGPMVVWDVITERLKIEAQNENFAAHFNAINSSQAVIEFQLDGTIIKANDNFLRAMGYRLEEIKGKHHSLFVDEAHARSAEYRELWARLNRGESITDTFRRLGKDHKEIWIQATYTPVRDQQGKPFMVVKYATDVTAQTRRNADFAGQIAAIGKAQAIIEFDLDGTITTANENFLKTVGYRLEDIRGKHHSMFVEESFKRSSEYREFWAQLNRGEYVAGEFKRIGAGGKEIWIQASYNPILDATGRPFKVVKFASDITSQMRKLNAANDFEREIQGVVNLVTSAATEMQQNSKVMAATADETARQSQVVSAASEEATRNVETVSSAAEELSASISEIARHVQDASKISAQAVQEADKTNTTIHELGDSSQEIGQVIKVITSIAQQTNLLALNATIEAARAGEAGKGFAVVANEVKELARQTAKATEEISQKIEAIQGATNVAVKAIQSIGSIIGRINEISTTIASAVEEQTAATNEISRNVAEAAKGTAEVTNNITGVSRAADEGGKGASDMLTAANSLAQESVRLDQLTKTFLQRLRTA